MNEYNVWILIGLIISQIYIVIYSKVNKAVSINTNSLLNQKILEYTYFNGNYLNYILKPNIEGNIKFVLTDYLGNSQEVFIKSNSSPEGRIKLNFPNNLIILNVISDEIGSETLKLIK